MQVIVHGGAGSSEPDEPEQRQAVLDKAANNGTAASDPLSAVETSVRVLESSPRFNAGVGSAVQSDGTIRTEAGVMTSDRQVGAVSAMEGVEHAVSAARIVLQETPHVMVTSPQAVALAEDHNVEVGVDLWTEQTRERWADVDRPSGPTPREHLAWLRSKFGAGHDTVGAVARDGDSYAAATSTGGRWYALAGRVGDVPQVGCGYYCSSAGGASATGAGEDIARVTLARKAVDYLDAGHGAQTAARFALSEFSDCATTGANAGLIVFGEDGPGHASTRDAHMQVAAASD